jgi:O-antigen chain-terminating methyltransferase
MEINDPRITIESLMDKIREGARRQASANGASPSGASSIANSSSAPRADDSRAADTRPSSATAPLTLQPDFEPHADDSYHASDLLKYHDRNFIQNSYLAILKRGPDATGFTSFIEGLRSGRLNKIDVLARLRYSTEGRAKRVQVKGLFLPAAVRQLYRVPLVGYLLHLGVALLRLPTTIRSQQQFEAHTHAQQQLIVDHANHLSAALGQQQREVAHRWSQISLEQRRAIELLRQEQQSLLAAERESLLAAQQALREALLERIEMVKQQFDVLIDKSMARWQRETQLMETRQTEHSAVTRAHAEKLTRDVRAEVETMARQMRTEVEQVFHKEQEIRTELSLQGRRVARLLEDAAQQSPASFEPDRLEAFADERGHLHDAFYLSLEDHFRGSPSEIKERLKVYLPLVEKARAAASDAQQPVLDIGCGRGEWLELLRETGVPASGVDSNRALVAEGRARDLSIVEADLMDYLRDLPDESLWAMTGFHIIEHLPLEQLLKLLDETIRVLRPGGLVIFETPNPENVLVGSCNFYFDPTHRNPLPAPIMKFMLESRGLNRAEIMRLNPSAAEPVAGDTDLVKRFNQYFYGPMDYAIVGWKI